MGTTAEKLSYLNETKTKIKNALETPYNVFRDYPAMIKKYIDNQPTKIVTNGICDNAVELPIVSLKSKGNNYQETTQGKNLFDNTLKDYAYYGNLAKTISTGVRLSVSSPITTSDIIFTVYSIMDLSNFVGKTVRMKATYKSNSALTGKYKIGLCDDKAGNRNAKASSSFTGQEISFIVPEIIEEQKYLAIWFYTNAGGTGATGDYVDYTNVIVTIDNEDMTYEPYTGGIPSPSPNYPQDIEVVDGCNRFDETEILKAEGWTKNSDGYYNGSFLKWNNAFNTKTSGFTIKGGFRVNTQYILLFKGYVSGGTASFRIKYDDETFSNYLFSNTSEELHTIVSIAGKNVVGLYGTYTSGGGNTLYVKDVQFIEGTALKPYLPYGSIGLKQSGKNLFNFNGVTNPSIATYESGVATLTWDSGFNVFFLSNSNRTLIGIDSKKNYTVIFKHKGNSIQMFNYATIQYGVSTKDDNEYVEYKFTITGVDFIELNAIRVATSGTAYIKEIMIYEGIENAIYEPYHEPKVIEINLNGNTLAKVGDVKDILKVNRNGEVEIEKSVGKINLKDITFWYQDKELSNSNRFYTNEIIYANSNLTLSNYFKYSNIQNINTLDEQGLCVVNNRQIALRINKTLVTNVNELKQWLLKHDVEVYYQLTTSEVIKLPSINPIELWQGTNIFKLITNLETNFEVEYVVDKDSMLDEVQTAMLNAEIEI